MRVLEENIITPLGSNKPIKVDVRVVSATNKDLEKAKVKGEFREDLYYRLKEISIYLPPLRERREDIPLLTEYFLPQIAQELAREREITML